MCISFVRHVVGRSSGSSSSSSGSSSTKLHERLKVFARTRENSGLSVSLQQLQTSIFAVLVLLIILVIARFFVIDSLISTYGDYLEDIYGACRRWYLARRILKSTYMLALAHRTPAFFSPQQATVYSSSIAADVAEMETINSYLYLSRNQHLSAANAALYAAEGTVTMTSIRPTLGNPNLDSTAHTFWDAVKMYAMKARAVAALPFGKVSDNDVNTFFILNNGDGPFARFLQQVIHSSLNGHGVWFESA